MPVWALGLLKWFAEKLIKWGFRKKKEADIETAKTNEKVIEDQEKANELEHEIRDEQDKVDEKPSDVEDEDGGLKFDKFNNEGNGI